MNLTFEEIPWGLVAPLIILHLILMIIALIDCIRSEVTRGPKWIWIIISICVSLLGPVIYFVFGRRQD